MRSCGVWFFGGGDTARNCWPAWTQGHKTGCRVCESIYLHIHKRESQDAGETGIAGIDSVRTSSIGGRRCQYLGKRLSCCNYNRGGVVVVDSTSNRTNFFFAKISAHLHRWVTRLRATQAGPSLALRCCGQGATRRTQAQTTWRKECSSQVHEIPLAADENLLSVLNGK